MTASDVLNTPISCMDHKTRWTWVVFTGFLAALCAVVVVGRLYRKEAERREQAQQLADTTQALIDQRAHEDEVLESLQETTEHGYMALDKDGRVTKWNPGMYVLTGRTSKEMIGQTLESVMEPKDYAAHSKAYSPWIKNPATDIKTLRLECKLIHASGGKNHPVFVTARKVLMDGAEPYAIGLVDLRTDVIDLTKARPNDVTGPGSGQVNRNVTRD